VKQLKFAGRRWWLWTRWLALAYLSANVALFLAQERIIFEPQPSVKENPGKMKVAYQDVSIPVGAEATDDRAKMHGWWLTAQGKKLGTILYLHSKRGNIGDVIPSVAELAEAGFNVLVVDYRGYGKSEGKFPSEEQLYADADAMRAYLIGEKKVNPQQVILYGNDLGGAIAIYLAHKHPDFAGAIVQNSFTSMSDVLNRAWWLKIFPTTLLLTQKFDSLDRVRTLNMPILYVHGTADEWYPVDMSRTLFAATPAPKKQLTLVTNGQHDPTGPQYRTPQHRDTVMEFINSTLQPANNSDPPMKGKNRARKK
jgi:uncharacterized protein